MQILIFIMHILLFLRGAAASHSTKPPLVLIDIQDRLAPEIDTSSSQKIELFITEDDGAYISMLDGESNLWNAPSLLAGLPTSKFAPKTEMVRSMMQFGFTEGTFPSSSVPDSEKFIWSTQPPLDAETWNMICNEFQTTRMPHDPQFYAWPRENREEEQDPRPPGTSSTNGIESHPLTALAGLTLIIACLL